MSELIIKTAELEAKLTTLQAQTELLFGYVGAKFGRDDFLAYLKAVSESEEFFEGARQAARKILLDEEMNQRAQRLGPKQ